MTGILAQVAIIATKDFVKTAVAMSLTTLAAGVISTYLIRRMRAQCGLSDADGVFGIEEPSPEKEEGQS